MALTLLEHQWHQRDPAERLGIIRAVVSSHHLQKDWGRPMSLVYKTGPSLGMPITTDVKQLTEWIQDFKAEHLLIYPNTLAALTAHCKDNHIRIPSLKHLRTMSETLNPSVKTAAETYFGCKVVDTCSSQELGVIAMQCPISALYHCAACNVLVEVLNDKGEPCQVGETGRVVLTDLFNFATPLVRYDIGDYAEVGLL